MVIQVGFLTIATALVAVIALAQPWRERDWALGAVALGILGVSYVIAVLLVLRWELPSPILLVKRLTQAILSLF